MGSIPAHVEETQGDGCTHTLGRAVYEDEDGRSDVGRPTVGFDGSIPTGLPGPTPHTHSTSTKSPSRPIGVDPLVHVETLPPSPPPHSPTTTESITVETRPTDRTTEGRDIGQETGPITGEFEDIT